MENPSSNNAEKKSPAAEKKKKSPAAEKKKKSPAAEKKKSPAAEKKKSPAAAKKKSPAAAKKKSPAAAKKKSPASAEESLKQWTPKVRPPVTEKMSFNRMEQFDYVREATKKNVWYYRDRLSVPRGPCTLTVLRECWVNGIIDQNTLIWGQGLIDWLPIKNVRTLVPQIRTPEVRFTTWMKKHIAIKPAFARAHRQNPEKFTSPSCPQIDDMY